MGFYDKIDKGLCPNDCGELTKFEKPISILYVVPPDVLMVLYEGVDTPEDIFGYLIAHCDKCGFNLTTTPKDDAFKHFENITVLGLEPIPLFSSITAEKRSEQ